VILFIVFMSIGPEVGGKLIGICFDAAPEP